MRRKESASITVGDALLETSPQLLRALAEAGLGTLEFTVSPPRLPSWEVPPEVAEAMKEAGLNTKGTGMRTRKR